MVNFAAYAALPGAVRLRVLFQQVVAGSTGLRAGASIPSSRLVMLLFTSGFGGAAVRIGVRPLMIGRCPTHGNRIRMLSSHQAARTTF
jgi:hypothetical protein